MNLDLRIPMGMMFAMMGAVLMAFGLAAHNRPELSARIPHASADLWWGMVLLVFGMLVLSLGRRGQGRIEQRKKAQAKR